MLGRGPIRSSQRAAKRKQRAERRVAREGRNKQRAGRGNKTIEINCLVDRTLGL